MANISREFLKCFFTHYLIGLPNVDILPQMWINILNKWWAHVTKFVIGYGDVVAFQLTWKVLSTCSLRTFV